MHQFEHRASTSVRRGTAIQLLPSVASSGSGLQSRDATPLSHDVHVQSRDSHMQSDDAKLGSVDSDDDDTTFFDAAEIIPADEWGRMESPTELESFHSAIVELPTPIQKESGHPADQLPVGKENTMIVSEAVCCCVASYRGLPLILSNCHGENRL